MHVPRVIEAHLGSRQVARVVYGAIVGLALVVGLEAHPPSAGVMAATLLATGVAVGLAELYSELLGYETRTRHLRVPRAEMAAILGNVAATVLGVGFPAVFFLLAAADVLSVQHAFTVAKWSGLGLAAFYGFCAARLAGAGLARAAVHAAAVGLIGGVLVGVKSLLH